LVGGAEAVAVLTVVGGMPQRSPQARAGLGTIDGGRQSARSPGAAGARMTT
jgi:hypothetical protein